MQKFLIDKKSEELILFFSGWGMDEKPLYPLESSCDVLHLFDYSNLDFEFDFSKYKKISLLAFSAGIFMAAYLHEKLPKCELKVALNGTLKLFDESEGLPLESFNLMKNVNMYNIDELRWRLMENPKHLKIFNKYQPTRTFESSINELEILKRLYEKPNFDFKYDKVILAKNDKIIPFENQLLAWRRQKNTRIMNSEHFSFYNFKTFEEIINL